MGTWAGSSVGWSHEFRMDAKAGNDGMALRLRIL
jgi:hypothetical protein